MADGTLEFELKVLGDVILKRRLSRFGEGVQDFTPSFERIVNILETRTKQHFDSHGSGEWAPLSPRYAAWKAEHYPGKPIMRRSDNLYTSLTSKGGGNIRDIQPLRLRWGTRVDYAIYHQKGGGRLPRRRVVHLIDDAKKEIMKELQRYVVELSRRQS